MGVKVAILGARPKTKERAASIGYYHAREFHRYGVKVVSVLGSSEESAKLAADTLKQNFRIEASPYSDLELLLKDTKPDAVVVSTPPELHYQHAKLALESGAHVLCEKPAYWDLSKSPEENIRMIEELFGFACEEGKILTINTQLVAPFNTYLENHSKISGGRARNKNFYVKMITPSKGEGVYVAMDLLPHGLSFLVKTSPDITLNEKGMMSTTIGNSSILRIPFNYNDESIDAIFWLGKIKDSVQRTSEFGFEDFYVSRISKQTKKNPQGISYFLESNRTPRDLIPIEDPLMLSIRGFCDAVIKRDESYLLVKPSEALINARLHHQIMSYLYKQM